MSLDRVKAETSSSQFVLWMQFFDWELNAFDRQSYYLAQIAAEVRRSYVKLPMSVKVENFLLKFISKVEKSVPMDRHTRANIAKRFFFGLTGLTGRGRQKK